MLEQAPGWVVVDGDVPEEGRGGTGVGELQDAVLGHHVHVRDVVLNVEGRRRSGPVRDETQGCLVS